MTRGDTLRANVNITRDGEPYVPEEGDSIRFAVKRDYKDTALLILKNISIGTLVLKVDPEDTKPLDFGKYVYDIQMTFADGSVDTFISGKLVLTPEVE